MSVPAQPLLLAREQADLSPPEMAFLLDVDESDLLAYESGNARPPPEFVERFATVLGLSVRELLAGEEPTAVALLFRRMSREHGPFVEAVDAGLPETLGEFVRSARTVARLRELLAEDPDSSQLQWLEHFKSRRLISRLERRQDFYDQVADMARSVRAYLNLSDTDEIRSMRELMGQLGIITMFVDPDRMDRDIDGASLLNPQPAVLVNLVGGGQNYWRTRMTLAHELCHLLFDRAEFNPANPHKFFLFSPKISEHEQRRSPTKRPQRTWHAFERFEDLEARANAFAGELLAPTSGVLKLIGSHDPKSSDSIARIADHFRIGLETAVNRLQNSFRLNNEARLQMLHRSEMLRTTRTQEYQALNVHPDCAASSAQLHDSNFVELVMRAFARSKIDALEVRSILHLRLSDPLPETSVPLPPTTLAPLLPKDNRLQRMAEFHLYDRVGVDHFIDSITGAEDGWHVRVCRRSSDGTAEFVGELLLAADFSVVDDSSLQDSDR